MSDGSRIIAEDRGGTLIHYYYDQTGVIGMNYNGSDYIFIKDALGNITEIYNSKGVLQAQYVYDAWGNTIHKSGILAEVNPFRYRGYYIDTETGWYYLQTRYYDPSVRRFINADNYELIPQLANNNGELNLYSYCNNNPVMYTDETGQSVFLTILIIALITGAVAGGAANGKTSYDKAKENGYSGWDLAGRTIGGVVVGAFVGATIAAGVVTFGYALTIGVAAMISVAVPVSLIQTTALSMAIFMFGGTVITSILGADWEGPGWPSGQDYPTPPTSPPIGSFRRLTGRNNRVMQYNLV